MFLPVPQTAREAHTSLRPRSLLDAHAAMPCWRTRATRPPDTDAEAEAQRLGAPPLLLAGCPSSFAPHGATRHQLLTAGLPASLDARAVAAAMRLMPTSLAGCVGTAWSHRAVLASPDAFPLCGDVPGLEPGRAALLTGEMQHAMTLASRVRTLLRRTATPSDAPLLAALSGTREALRDAAREQRQAEEAAEAAFQAGAGEREEEEKRVRDAPMAPQASLVQGRAKRNPRGEDGDSFQLQPRAPRRL